MVHLKDKICAELEYAALADDPQSLELLVDNKIIDLQLPIVSVYDQVMFQLVLLHPMLSLMLLFLCLFQVWKKRREAQSSPPRSRVSSPSPFLLTSGEDVVESSTTPMLVLCRMRGLEGEATEDVITTLPLSTDQLPKDPEQEFPIVSVFQTCGGLETLLTLFSSLTDLNSDIDRTFIRQLTRTLSLATKIRSNRLYLFNSDLGTAQILVQKIRLALEYPSTLDVAESLLTIMENILLEGSQSSESAFKAQQASSSMEVERPAAAPTVVPVSFPSSSFTTEQLNIALGFLSHPSVASNPTLVRCVVRSLPLLTAGLPSLVLALFNHFASALNWDAINDVKTISSSPVRFWIISVSSVVSFSATNVSFNVFLCRSPFLLNTLQLAVKAFLQMLLASGSVMRFCKISLALWNQFVPAQFFFKEKMEPLSLQARTELASKSTALPLVLQILKCRFFCLSPFF